jgi:hypothetical protein
MIIAVFIQRSRFGKRVYELRDSNLTISGVFAFKKFERRVNMQHISPEFIRVRRYVVRFVYVPLIFACLAGLLIRGLRFLPGGPYFLVVVIGAILVVTWLWQAVRGISPVEIVAFRNANNHVQFDIVKEEAQAAEFEEFIAQLSKSITGTSDSAPSGLADRRLVSLPEGQGASRGYWWIGSLSLGFAAGLLLIANRGNQDPSVVVLTFPCSFGGLFLCIYSFVAKERFRYLSVIGALMALAPIFFH